jgi:hypothetical protein
MKRDWKLILAGLSLAAFSGVAAAHSGDRIGFGISIGAPAPYISSPPVVIAPISGGAYYPPPVYYSGPPAYYAPPRVYYAPPPQIHYERGRRHEHWREQRHHERHHERHRERHGGRDGRH